MLLALVFLPILSGISAFFITSDTFRRILLLSTAFLHFAMTLFFWFIKPISLFDGWIEVGPLEQLFLTITSTLFLAASIYAMDYLRLEKKERRKDFEEDFFFSNVPEARFTTLLLFFLGTMSLVIISQHIGLMWVAVEATTLVSAPLICYHHHHRSLEAAWKYLLICSVGIGLALLGNFFLVVALTPAQGERTIPMTVAQLLSHARQLDPSWLKASFLLMLVGYGTKMGLAPLHTWLPDAHSEAPSFISALLSGALLNCALLAILRLHALCLAAGLGSFSGNLLVLFGVISMGIGAIFILSQNDFKRMLAYSSVEHMGIIAIGFGIGGLSAFGSVLHVINHSGTKAMLFFLCGNLLATYGTKEIKKIQGVMKRVPMTGFLWLAGFFAIVGSPPFGLFVSEFAILKGAFEKGYILAAVLAIGILAIIFISMASIFIKMTFGEEEVSPKENVSISSKNNISWLRTAPILCLGITVLLLGLYLPTSLQEVIQSSLHFLETP